MNGFSIKELCCLFCCPPCPGRIAAKLAFLPPMPTYAVLPEQEASMRVGTGRGATGVMGRWKLHLTDRADFQYTQRELDTIEVFMTKSSRGNRIACMYIRCAPSARSLKLLVSGGGAKAFVYSGGHVFLPWGRVLIAQCGEALTSIDVSKPKNGAASSELHIPFDWEQPIGLDGGFVHYCATGGHVSLIGCSMATVEVSWKRFTLLFSHGNAVDLGQMSSFYLGLGTRINCNIFSYDYSGYGASSGRPSEKNLYADIDAAWQALRTRYGICPENILLYGQSIGTVPTVDLASRYECAAVILHSPLTSGMRVAFPDTKKTYCFDAFPNIEKVSKITSPVLIIHGTEDEVIDFSHGLALYERCPKTVEPLWVEGAGHNDIELYSQYLERLKRFISQELTSQSSNRE